MKSFSLVLPCYNESKSLARLADRAISCAKKYQMTERDFQLVLVDNGSTDDSARVLTQIKKGPLGGFLKTVDIRKNQGYGHGLLQGLKSVTTEIAGWSHADEQCDPNDAFRAWNIVSQSKKPILVKGRRTGRALPDRVISKAHGYVATLLYQKRFNEINAQPKVFPTDLVELFFDAPKDFSFDFYVLAAVVRAGVPTQEILVDFPERAHGESKWAATFSSKFAGITKSIGFMVKNRVR